MYSTEGSLYSVHNELLHLEATGSVMADNISRLRIGLGKLAESRFMKRFQKVLGMNVDSDISNLATVDAGLQEVDNVVEYIPVVPPIAIAADRIGAAPLG